MGKTKVKEVNFNRLLARVIGILDYYSIPYETAFSFKDGNSCYIGVMGIEIRISDHGARGKNRECMYNFRAYKTDSEIARELLLLRKFIRKGRKYHVV